MTTMNRDYTTTQDGEGGFLDEPIPMRCEDCGRPAYYDDSTENYHHAVAATVGCFLIGEEDRPDDMAHPLMQQKPCTCGHSFVSHDWTGDAGGYCHAERCDCLTFIEDTPAQRVRNEIAADARTEARNDAYAEWLDDQNAERAQRDADFADARELVESIQSEHSPRRDNA